MSITSDYRNTRTAGQALWIAAAVLGLLVLGSALRPATRAVILADGQLRNDTAPYHGRTCTNSAMCRPMSAVLVYPDRPDRNPL